MWVVEGSRGAKRWEIEFVGAEGGVLSGRITPGGKQEGKTVLRTLGEGFGTVV